MTHVPFFFVHAKHFMFSDCFLFSIVLRPEIKGLQCTKKKLTSILAM
uniref:Uncharacterized protein n=1 Tax=Arundo donax TaxID=35708 RepID=A0A0A9H8Z0_ARUDO